MPKKVTKAQATKLGKQHKLNFDVIPFDEWHAGLNIEMEHQNVSHGSLEITALIALAHLKEFPDYYKYLIKLEKAREEYWKSKKKPSIFLK